MKKFTLVCGGRREILLRDDAPYRGKRKKVLLQTAVETNKILAAVAKLGKEKMKVFVCRKVGAITRADASAEEFQNRLASGIKKAEDLLNARAAQIWKAEQSKVSHDVSKGKFRIPFSLRFSAEEGDFELKLQFISSGSHGIPAKTMDSATMGKVVRIIKSSLGASRMNVSPLRISSEGTGGAPTIGFLTLKGKVSVERGDALKRLDWTKDRKFESHLLRMFEVIKYEGNKVQFISAEEASSAYSWIKDEYPQYKNKMNLNGNTIGFF